MNKFRLKALKAVYRKEIIDILRDKRTLIIMILLPLVLYPVIMLGSSQITMLVMRSEEEKLIDVAFDFSMDSKMEKFINEHSDDYKINIKNIEDPAKGLENGEILAYVTCEERGSKEVYKIYYDSSNSETNTPLNKIRDLFRDYKETLTVDYIEEAGLDPDFIMEPIVYEAVDVAEDEEKTGMFFGMIIPFIMIVGLVTGAIYPAIDVTSGEKERGTLETLLTLPISNMELMGGKFLAVSTVAVVSGILNFLSMILVGLLMINSVASQVGSGGDVISINLASLVIPFVITLICIIVFAFFVSAVVLCVTSFARSFKEANNYVTPVVLLFMLPAFVAIVPNVKLTSTTAAIPVVNIALTIKEVMSLKYDFASLGIVLISNIMYALIAVVALSKIYNSENVLFGTGIEFNFLEKRSHIKKGSKINPGDGIILYSLGILVLFYLSSFFMLKFGFYGIAATQAVIFAMPLLAALYLKADFRNTFRLKLPRFRDIMGGLVLWIGTFIVTNIVGNLLLYLFPQGEEVVSQLNVMLKGDNIWTTLLVAALLPAICEELFFRGFIFSSLEGSVKNRNAVILTGLLFGLYHIDFIRILPTFILGIAFTYAVLRTGSIFIPIMMHFVNNAVAVFSLFYPEDFEGFNRIINITGNDWINSIIYLIIGILLIMVGYRVLKPKRE